MVEEKTPPNVDALSARSKRLISYSFDSITQRHTSHLLDCPPLISPAPSKAVQEFHPPDPVQAPETPANLHQLPFGAFLIPGFLLGVFGVLLFLGPERDLVGDGKALLAQGKAVVAYGKAMFAGSTPALAPIVVKPTHAAATPEPIAVPANPVQTVTPPAIQESATAPNTADTRLIPQETSPKKEEAAGAATDDCVGARLAFGLCSVK